MRIIDCTQDACNGNICSNPFEAAETLCDSGNGECDGSGNCGVCSDASNPCLQVECKEEILCTASSCDEQGDLAVGTSCASGDGVCNDSGVYIVTENFCLWDYQEDCSLDKGTSIFYGFALPWVGSVSIGGESEIVGMEFTIWQTCSDQFEVVVNDESIGIYDEFTDFCNIIPSSVQWPGKFVIEGSAVNDYWNFGGVNTISFDPSGYDAVSSISVDITYKLLA